MSEIIDPTFDCRFDFHPVGQGLFYSGRVNDKRFVYDCGTTSGSQYLGSAIDRYVTLYEPERIDLLILSHFHQDHISGVRSLLRKTSGAEEVVLPYLFPEERLMIAAGYAIQEELDNLDDDFASFLSDPIEYLESSGEIERYTLLRSSTAELGQTALDRQSGEYGWSPDYAFPNDSIQEIVSHASSNKIRIRSDSSFFRIPRWGFRFYCQPGKVAREDILRELGALKPPISAADIQSAIANRLVDLKDVYYSLFGGVSGQNSTSIVCCHGPAMPRGLAHPVEIEIALRASIGVDVWQRTWHHQLCVGRVVLLQDAMHPRQLLAPMTLLTGDANLRITQLTAYFQNDLTGIGVASLPHHGSAHNYRREFPQVMPNCQCWVASFGIGNRYKHPGKTVLGHVLDQQRTFLQCNESQGISFLMQGWMLP